MTSDIPWLECFNIEAWLESKKVFNDFNLNLYLNDNTVIIGPNGSGKSTLLRLIERSIYPIIKKNSSFKLFGSETINLWSIRKNIGFVSNNIEDRIPYRVKAIDLVCSGYYGSMFLKSEQVISTSQKESASNIFMKLGLQPIMNKFYGELSQGQRRSVIIARSLISKPKVLVLDEPLVSLDFGCKFKLLNLLNLISSNGTTILHTTHNIESINKYTKRIILLKEGRILYDGDPLSTINSKHMSELFDYPMKTLSNNGHWQVFPD